MKMPGCHMSPNLISEGITNTTETKMINTRQKVILTDNPSSNNKTIAE